MHYQTPFYDLRPVEQANAAGEMGLRIRVDTLDCAWLLHTWPQDEAAFFADLAAHLVLPDLGQTRHLEDDTLVVRSGPSEVSLLHRRSSALAERIAASVHPERGAALDLRHAKVCVQIQGDKVAAVLQKLFALDFRLPHFPIGHFRSSGFHHAPAALHRIAEHDFDLYLPSTYAKDQAESLLDAALEFGYRLELAGK